MSMNILNDISTVYLQQVAEKKDDSYLETNMKKRHENNEKAREEMKRTKANKDMVKAARKSMGIEDDDEDDINEATYSAKAARAGKDIGKPGKAFAKIAKSAAERYGSEERGKKVAGAVLAKLRKEALDPAGQEDADIDNDGDTDKSDKYLHNRRKAVGKAIAKKKGMKEGFSNWRQDLSEVMDDVEVRKEIKEKKVSNKIKINPEMKEAVEQLGGELIEMVEIEEERNDEPGEGKKQKYGDMRGLDRSGAPTSFGGKWQSDERKKAGAAALTKLKKEETEIDEAVYGATKKKEEEKEKDTRLTVTAADKRGMTVAYKRFKAGDKRYKAAPHLGEGTLQEKALSKQQQKFMGMVYAVKKGDMAAPSPEVAKAAAGMTKQQAKDFAKTKHKGLPQVKEAMDEPMEPAVDKQAEMQKKKIQMQKVRELTTRLQSARKGVY